MNRRSFLGATAGAALTCPSSAATKIPIIDCHIHLFDTARPQGVPWPEKKNTALYKPAMPDRYRSIAVPLGVTGAIKVEASPWLEDNQWVLDVAAKDKIIVGVVGNLEPGKPEFAKNLERFHKNKLFLGIRCGNLWDRNFTDDVKRPEFIADVKLLAKAGLSMDTANPNPSLMADVVRLTDRVPELRFIIDHLPQMAKPTDPAILRDYKAHLQEIGKRPQIYVKISEVFRRVDGKIPTDLGFYKANLDEIFGVFGEDRVLYGSDWPNSDNWLPYPEVLRIAQEYFNTKGQVAAEKYFWKNSVKAYRWVKRDSSQPSA
ncbi:MAG TPA: amidohydrolase family protein [Bryobacteraceae bacterium]|nr:amidohydrolase family protein [Bryobacteraceae bacterium]